MLTPNYIKWCSLVWSLFSLFFLFFIILIFSLVDRNSMLNLFALHRSTSGIEVVFADTKSDQFLANSVTFAKKNILSAGSCKILFSYRILWEFLFLLTSCSRLKYCFFYGNMHAWLLLFRTFSWPHVVQILLQSEVIKHLKWGRGLYNVFDVTMAAGECE